jgi:hypothetical protein
VQTVDARASNELEEEVESARRLVADRRAAMKVRAQTHSERKRIGGLSMRGGATSWRRRWRAHAGWWRTDARR